MSGASRKVWEELRKFAGFLVPDDIGGLVANALNSAGDAKASLPWKNEKIPVIVAVCAVANSKKFEKQAVHLMNAVCDFILAGGIKGRALVATLGAVRNFSLHGGAVFALRALQFVATILPKYYGQSDVLRMIFSVSLSLCGHPADIANSVAFATSQQMISLVVNYCMTDGDGAERKEMIRLARFVSVTFKKPLSVIPYMLLQDIVSMISGEKVAWLEVAPLPPSTVFRLLEMIVSSHTVFLVGEPALLEVLESAVVMPLVHDDEVPFLVTFVVGYMDVLPVSCVLVFSYFLGRLNADIEDKSVYIMFFRSVFTRSTSFLVQFHMYCNQDASLLEAMLESMDRFAEEQLKDLTTMFVRDQFDARSAPIEVAERVVASLTEHIIADESSRRTGEESPSVRKSHGSPSCVKDGTGQLNCTVRRDEAREEYEPLAEILWPKLFSLIIRGIRYADAKSIDSIFEVFEQLIRVVKVVGLVDTQTALLRILCNLVAKHKSAKEGGTEVEILSKVLLHTDKKGLLFREKRVKAHIVLVEFLNTTPDVFHRMYLRLFLGLSAFPEHKIDPEFTTHMQEIELSRLCKALTKGNPFCLEFLENVLVANQPRFNTIFEAIVKHLMRRCDDVNTAGIIYNIMISASTTNFDASNEKMFLELFVDLIENVDTEIDDRISFLNHMTFLVVNKGEYITKGWSLILDAISLSDTTTDERVVAISSRILGRISNHHMDAMAEDNVWSIVDHIFELGSQKVDINISLSSFDFLWIVLPRVHQKAEFWKHILSKTIAFSGDDRTDVAVSAVRTAFSLLASNAKELPVDVFPYIINDCFITEIRQQCTFPQSMWPVQQLLFQEMAQCAASFWEFFAPLPAFEATFWSILIEQHETFMKNCGDSEIIVDGFQFYVISFGCELMHTMIRQYLVESFGNVINHILANEPSGSMALASMGRYVSQIVEFQKLFLTKETLTVWLRIISGICALPHTDAYVSLSAEKSVSGIVSLFPLSPFMMHMVAESLVSIITTCKLQYVREAVAKALCSVLDTSIDKLRFFRLCQCLAANDDAKIVFEAILAVNITTDDVDDLFSCYYDLDEKSSLAPHVRARILALIPRVSDTWRKRFVALKSRDADTLRTLWSRFCDPDSQYFSTNFYNSCFREIVRSIGDLLRVLSDEGADDELIDLLTFLETAKVPGGGSDRFVFNIASQLLVLATDKRPQIRCRSCILLEAMQLHLTRVLK